MRPGAIYVGSLMPLRNLDAVQALASGRVTSFSTDAIPRTTRAQAMDTLSSMANIAGYKGVLLAAVELNKYFPMLMTAAGTVPPAKVFVIGAGVAGLQAIATARRLGANVFATDVRPEVKEQIESVGGKYVGIELKEGASAGGGYAKELTEEDRLRQRELLAAQCAQSDAVITTALIGGVFAPRLISADMVRAMKPGAVIVDLAADGGGNCELSRPGETVTVQGITILAPLESAGHHAAARESAVLPKPDRVRPGFHQRQGLSARPQRRHPARRGDHPRRRGETLQDPGRSEEGANMTQPLDFWSMMFVFVLASFIGVGVIRRVSRLLHTPLMSITNAISAIAVVGSIIVTGADYPRGIRILGAIALFASMTNIVSGFLITDRMLKMFKSERKPGPDQRP